MSVSSRKIRYWRGVPVTCTGLYWMAEAGTPAENAGEFRNLIWNCALFSKKSMKWKSSPPPPALSGIALIKRRPAVGRTGLLVTVSNLLHAPAAPATMQSTESFEKRLIKYSVVVEAAGRRLGPGNPQRCRRT